MFKKKDKPVRVLIVDDDKDFLEQITLKLEKYGFEVHATANPDEAATMAEKIQPVIILLDIQMPKKDGFQVAQEISAKLSGDQAKVVFFTNTGESNPQIIENNRRLSKEFGAIDYIKKGTDLDVVANTIEELARK
ncbi:MAG: response regulator [bacterium]|nr:response regulator [bacterium]